MTKEMRFFQHLLSFGKLEPIKYKAMKSNYIKRSVKGSVKEKC